MSKLIQYIIDYFGIIQEVDSGGEVIYALNYNIKERDGDDLDGAIDAADAADVSARPW